MDQIVAILVFDKVRQNVHNRSGKFEFLLHKTSFEAPLHHATPLFVSADFYWPLGSGVEDEVGELIVVFSTWGISLIRSVCGFEVLDEILDHVVSVDVRAKSLGSWFEFPDYLDQVLLHDSFLINEVIQLLDDRLHSSCAVLVKCNIDRDGKHY